MKKIINLTNVDQLEEVHNCTATRKGEWVIFTCPMCLDYERRINLRTGDMKTYAPFTTIKHNGTYMPEGLQPEIYNPN
jgi:hypothetical protein